MIYIIKKQKTIMIVILTILVLITVLCGDIEIRGALVRKEIKNFTSRGEYVETIDDIDYYAVHKQYDYENTEDRIFSIGDLFVGTTGDIYINSTNPLENTGVVGDWLCNRLKMGHAAMAYSADASLSCESTAFYNAGVRIIGSDWIAHNHYMDEMFALRVKNITSDQRQTIKDWVDEKEGTKFNYFYLLRLKNRLYCSDFVARAYEEIGVDIDGHQLFSYQSTMICDDDTYLIFYCLKPFNETSNF